MGIISMLAGFLFFVSLMGLLVGFILVLSKKELDKKVGIQILHYSVIGLIVGFGTCAVLFKW
jgi:hypothetical protein